MKKRSYKRKRSTKSKRSSKNVSFAVKKFVKSTIHKNIEDKQHISFASNQSVTGPFFSLTLVPSLNQGLGESQRIGNTVTLRNASVRFIINQSPYNATTNPYGGPQLFRWMLLSQKRDNSGSLSLSSIWEVNNASIGPQSNHLDQLFKVNDELYKVHKQGKFRLGNSAQSNNFPVANSNYDSSKMSIDKTIYFGKYMKKLLRFDDNITLTPSNMNLWLVIFVSYANGSTTSSYVTSNISYVVTHQYEDA